MFSGDIRHESNGEVKSSYKCEGLWTVEQYLVKVLVNKIFIMTFCLSFVWGI